MYIIFSLNLFVNFNLYTKSISLICAWFNHKGIQPAYMLPIKVLDILNLNVVQRRKIQWCIKCLKTSPLSRCSLIIFFLIITKQGFLPNQYINFQDKQNNYDAKNKQILNILNYFKSCDFYQVLFYLYQLENLISEYSWLGFNRYN